MRTLVSVGHRFVFATLLVSLQSGCSLFLDFDQFEARAECAQCMGTDPCTQPACVSNGCYPEPLPRCEEEEDSSMFERCAQAQHLSDAGVTADAVLVPGHRLQELAGNVIHKMQVFVGRQFLYHVVYVETDGVPDVIIRAFALSSLDTRPDDKSALAPVRSHRVSEFAEPGSVVRSSGSIAVDTDDSVVLYVALSGAGKQAVALSRQVLSADLSAPGPLTRLTDPPNYRPSSVAGRVGPEAGYLATGKPFVAWQGCTSNDPLSLNPCADVEKQRGRSAIFTHAGSSVLTVAELSEQGVDEPLPITALQALSDGSLAAAVWGTTSSEKVVSVIAGVPINGHSRRLLQCDSTPEYTFHSLHAAPTFNGISSLVWSKRKDGEVPITEAASIACGPAQCLDFADPDNTMPPCTTPLHRRRVTDAVMGASHGVWMLDAVQSQAVVVSAAVQPAEQGQTRLVLSQTTGSPDPNVSPLFDSRASELLLAIGTPAWPELHLQRATHREAGSTYSVVGVGWVEKEGEQQVAKVHTVDLCFAQ